MAAINRSLLRFSTLTSRRLSLPSVAFTGLLDKYPGAAAAYSLRLLSSSFADTGIIQVRRDNDNDEVLVNVDKDLAAPKITLNSPLIGSATKFSDFIGINNGFLSSFIDQAGNGRDATQGITHNQPQIVSDGSLITDSGSQPVIDFKNTGDSLDLFDNGNATTFLQTCTLFMVSDITDTTYVLLSSKVNSLNSLNSDYYLAADQGGSGAFTRHYSLTSLWKNTVLQTLVDRDDVCNVLLGRAVTTHLADLNNSNRSSSILAIGGWDASPYTMEGVKISEMIFYDSDETANRTGIESEINTHYLIY